MKSISFEDVDFVANTSLDWSLYCRSHLWDRQDTHENSIKSLHDFSDLAVRVSKFFLQKVKKSGFENFRCVCSFDEFDAVSAIGVYEMRTDDLHIRYLLSNPRHFEADREGFLRKTQQLGSAYHLLSHIVSTAKVLRCSKVTLNALEASESFYLKAGFSFDEKEPSGVSVKTMVLNLNYL